jgi:hypothetical protein
MKRVAIALTILLAVAGCNKKDATQANAAPAPAVQSAQAQPQPDPRPSANLLTGKVVETFDGGGYTYVRVATASGDQWAAIPQAKVSKGDNVSIAAQMTMEKFESKTLNRTFDTIVFGSIAGPAGAAPNAPAMQAQMPPGHPPAGGQTPPMTSAMGSPSQHMASPDLGDIKIEKPAGGKSVAEVWAEKSALNGKEVVVRGKVVKFLGGIMGTNWMHVQDGTGSKAAGDNDLTVTTNEQVKVGDVVTIKGTLAADKDFGAGYRYAVIVEKAAVSK